MRVDFFSDPKQFAPAALDHLLVHEAENNLMIGLFEDLTRGRRDGRGEPALYIVRDENHALAGAALWAGFQLILTRGTPESHAAIADHLASSATHYPRASGPAPDTAAFALAYLNRTGRPHAPGPVMRLMQSSAVNAPPFLLPGCPRLASEGDFETAHRWGAAFVEELNLEPGDRSGRVRREIQEHNVLFWCDPDPVSMAIVVGRSPNGARIGSVYTPPELRRRGYASACVADLGRRLLGQGRQFVYLYAQATNRTSNHIYESIGFAHVCDWQEFDMSPVTSFDAPRA